MPISDYPFRVPDGYSLEKPALPIVLHNPHNGLDYPTWAIIDTGADTTVIPEHIAKSLYHDIRHPKVERDISFGINGGVEVYMHTFSIDILYSDATGKIGSKVVVKIPPKKFPVIPRLRTVVLGEQDFLKKYVVTINYPRHIFSIKKPTKK